MNLHGPVNTTRSFSHVHIHHPLPADWLKKPAVSPLRRSPHHRKGSEVPLHFTAEPKSRSFVVQSEPEVPSSSGDICSARMYLCTSAEGEQKGSLTHGPVQLAFANDTCSPQRHAVPVRAHAPVSMCVCLCVLRVLLHIAIKY